MEKKKAGRPPKAKTLDGSLSDKDKAYMRLKCISMVVEGGSRMDAMAPQVKAEEYYNFIIGKCTAEKDEKVVIEIEKPKEPISETINDVHVQKPVSNQASPFGESGRPQVFI